MKLVKTVLIGFVATASVAFAAACGDNDNGGSANPSASAASATASKSSDPKAQFTDATALLRGTPYKFDMKAGDLTYNGSDDPLAGIAVGKLNTSLQGLKVSIDAQLTQNDYWVKETGLPVPGIDTTKWLHLDPTKVTSLNAVSFGGPTDPTGLQDLATTVVSVESPSAKQLKGTFDFTKHTWGPVANAATVSGLGDKAKAVPFEATLDDQGRLTALKIMIPANGSVQAREVDVTYSDFGADVKPSSPASTDTVEAPDLVYTFINAA